MTTSAVEGPSASTVVEAYEALRQQATEHGASSHRERGLALLMRQGVAAWLQAYCRAAPRPLPRSDAAVVIPTDIRGDLALILAGMALGAGTKEAIA